MNPSQYLQRIHYKGSLNTTLPVLKSLQKNHLLSIPFENLDIAAGVPIELNINRIYSKIILNNRGGFCYELNRLLHELLTELGFSSKIISARVYDKKKGYGAEYDHLALIVFLEGVEYLVDVGFGEFAFAPLELVIDTVQKDQRGEFLLEQIENNYFRVSKFENEEWIPEYIFKNQERYYREFQEMCSYHQTSPHSNFTQKKLITRPTENGRITLSGNNLKIKNGTVLSEVEIKNVTQFNENLQKYFNLKI